MLVKFDILPPVLRWFIPVCEKLNINKLNVPHLYIRWYIT